MSTPDAEPTLRGLEADRRVFGRFVLLRRLGAGGMGEVWLARDESLPVEVCLKFLPEHVRWSPGALAAHKAEALRARALTHPNIVRVHDFVEDGPLAAIVMEFVDGRTLAVARLARPGGVLPPPAILAWLPQLAAALDYLHRTALVAHGDIKPANVLLCADGTLKLADFGVARNLPGARSAAGAGSAGGTLPYLSPQRLLGAPPTPADDIYALGALLYELLAGSPPFSEGDVAAQIEVLVPETIAARRRRMGIRGADSIPNRWQSTLDSCLAKQPDARPPDAGAVAARLAAASNRGKPRSIHLVAAGLCTAAALAGVWWWQAHALPPLKPAAVRSTTEFVEEFDSGGLAGWVRWGDPPPHVLRAYQGRTWVFDNNGDGIHLSGATSVAVIAAPQGFELRSEVRLDVINPAGCHLSAFVGLTRDPGDWMNALGSRGDDGRALHLNIDYVGDSCWASETSLWRHAFFGASFVADDGSEVALGLRAPDRQLADDLLGRWFTLRIVVDADRHARFYADDTLLFAPTQRLHPGLFAGQRVVVSGRSAGSAGKAYNDNVVVRAPPGATLQITTSPEAGAAPGPRLVWGDTGWTQRTAGDAAPVSWPADGDELSLESTEDGTVGLRSRQPVEDLTSVEFDLRPFLNSGGARPDVLTIFVERRGAGGWQRWGAEFRDTEIRLVERSPDGRDVTLGRPGTYNPGAWASFVFIRSKEGAIEFVGSRIQGTHFATRAAPGGDWAVGFEVSGSADGAMLRPPRVSLGPR